MTNKRCRRIQKKVLNKWFFSSFRDIEMKPSEVVFLNRIQIRHIHSFVFALKSQLSFTDRSCYILSQRWWNKEEPEYANWMSRARARDEVVILGCNICWCSPAARAASPHAGPIFCSVPQSSVFSLLLLTSDSELTSSSQCQGPASRHCINLLGSRGIFLHFPFHSHKSVIGCIDRGWGYHQQVPC